MDLGASLCAPRNPNCGECPLREDCLARKRGVQSLRPVRSVARPTPLRYYASVVILLDGKVLVRKRPDRGLLAGMWEFPNLATRSKTVLASGFMEQVGFRIALQSRLGIFKHAYSHFSVHCTAYFAKPTGCVVAAPPGSRWVAVRQLARLPMGNLDRRIANALRDVVR
jgi:A/G-specific adenine glycosylase